MVFCSGMFFTLGAISLPPALSAKRESSYISKSSTSSTESAAGIVSTRALEDSFSQGRATRDLARFMDGGVALPTSVFAQEIVKRIVD